MVKEFKEFISKGNVMDLAVGIIIGAAFKAIISSFVADILMPFISLILGNINISALKVVLRPAFGDVPELALRYGLFIQSAIDFIIIAFVIFMFIKLVNRMKRKKEETEEPPAPPEPTKEELLLTEIRDLLKK
ncbi:MAG: large-conductance mechanosensitive channel protein MscL [Clostridia bacterium]|nr:large-conductance mechanosensitive channel protein MscL [Clostridia bacterium]MBT7122969.1 large-conductance mechanosensitive channel protein MscL [Clostridia bacterium]